MEIEMRPLDSAPALANIAESVSTAAHDFALDPSFERFETLSARVLGLRTRMEHVYEAMAAQRLKQRDQEAPPR